MKNLITTTFLLFSLTFVVQAQQLEYPTKDCEGAKVTPDGLTSWCDTKYYNACECKFERAIENYNNKKEEIASDLYGLNKDRDVAWEKYQNSMNEAQKFKDKLNNDNPDYEEDKAKALQALAKAKEYANKAIGYQKKTDNLGKKIHGQQYGLGTTAMEADLKNVESSIETTNQKKKIVTQEVAVTIPKTEEPKEKEESSTKKTAQEKDPPTNNEYDIFNGEIEIFKKKQGYSEYWNAYNYEYGVREIANKEKKIISDSTDPRENDPFIVLEERGDNSDKLTFYSQKTGKLVTQFKYESNEKVSILKYSWFYSRGDSQKRSEHNYYDYIILPDENNKKVFFKSLDVPIDGYVISRAGQVLSDTKKEALDLPGKDGNIWLAYWGPVDLYITDKNGTVVKTITNGLIHSFIFHR